jgi:DNA polymerase-3 subunit epsilon
MKENKKIVKAINIRGNIKNPKLSETCKYCNIECDEEQYHSAIYDVTKTLEILNKMECKII